MAPTGLEQNRLTRRVLGLTRRRLYAGALIKASPNARPLWLLWLLLFFSAAVMEQDIVGVKASVAAATPMPQGFVFSTDADFLRGHALGVMITNGQLQLATSPETFPFIWIPNRDEATVSKLDTRTGREVARYRTGPYCCASPSAIVVDLWGNCWVANRDLGTVLKIGLVEAGPAVDRNGNGQIDTSRDLNGDGDITGQEILPWGEDEAVLCEVVLIEGQEGTFLPGTFAGLYARDHWNPGPRGLALDALGHLWVGTHDTMRYYCIDGDTGGILSTNNLRALNHKAFGATIDNHGLLWSSSWPETHLLRFDPSTGQGARVELGGQVCGVTLDADQHLFVSLWGTRKLARIDTQTSEIDWMIQGIPEHPTGLAVTPDGDVWLANTDFSAVTRWSRDGMLKNTIHGFVEPTGLSVDAAGKLWVVGQGDEYVHRLDPATDSIDLSKRLLGSVHDGTSDMTGYVARNLTGRFGHWWAVWEAGATNASWGIGSWRSTEPPGSHVLVRVRSSADRRVWSAWEWAQNGLPLTNTPPGRFVEVQVGLQAVGSGSPPELQDLTIRPRGWLPAPQVVSPRWNGSTFSMSCLTEPQASYVVEYTDNITNQVWSVLKALEGTGSVMSIVDADAGIPMRFYRVRVAGCY